MKNRAAALIAFCVMIVFAGYAGLSHRTVYAEINHPKGTYKAIVTYRSYLSLLPMSPGSSSDKPGFIRIVDSRGNDLGEIPLPMLQLAGALEWTSEGAQIPALGEWDIREGSCFYWSEKQDRKIYVRRPM